MLGVQTTIAVREPNEIFTDFNSLSSVLTVAATFKTHEYESSKIREWISNSNASIKSFPQVTAVMLDLKKLLSDRLASTSNSLWVNSR